MRRLAERLRPTALRARRGWHTAFGKNPLVLICAAAVSIARGQNYLDNGIPPGSLKPIEFLSGLIHPVIWSALYVIAGAALLLGLVWRRTFAGGAAACSVLWLLWGIAFLWAAIDGDGSVGAHVTGLTFIVFGGMIWTLASNEVDHDEWHRDRQGAAA